METKDFNVDNIVVRFEGYEEEDITEDMARAAVKYANDHKENDIFVISSITVTKEENGMANFDVHYEDDEQKPIGRIRRITG